MTDDLASAFVIRSQRGYLIGDAVDKLLIAIGDNFAQIRRRRDGDEFYWSVTDGQESFRITHAQFMEVVQNLGVQEEQNFERVADLVAEGTGEILDDHPGQQMISVDETVWYVTKSWKSGYWSLRTADGLMRESGDIISEQQRKFLLGLK